MAAILEVKNVSKHFGGLKAVDQVSLTINKGEIFGLIGPNGAGKSTLFNCVAGYYKPTMGDVFFKGEKITGVKPWNICKKKIGRTFQLVKPFKMKTVLYNTMVGAYARSAKPAEVRDMALAVLEELRLADEKDTLAKNLTIADRKRLEIARAMATDPELLLLDECMAGLRPNEVDEIIEILQGIRSRGVTIFVIEHIMRAIMALSDRIAVLQFGEKIMEGTPKEVSQDDRVIKAYLGESYVIAGN
ncbi:MAG: ABC transporter ATP-binding protein [Deltaproteobacteria bacterium]|nr:ABC transporter ATP-binding protein [Deltaproteobacteria bacterium]